jgi:hypothetical protein
MFEFDYDYNEKFTAGDHIKVTSGVYEGLAGMVVGIWPDSIFPYEVELDDAVDMKTWCFHETELALDYPELITEADDVNHPSHYAEGFSNGAEVIDITENLNFNRGNAVKYLARAGKKDPSKEMQDLMKARFYIEREIARMEAAK